MNWLIAPLLMFVGLPLLVHGRRGYRRNPDNNLLRGASGDLDDALADLVAVEDVSGPIDDLGEDEDQYDRIDLSRAKNHIKLAMSALDMYRQSPDDPKSILERAAKYANVAKKEVQRVDDTEGIKMDLSMLNNAIAGIEGHLYYGGPDAKEASAMEWWDAPADDDDDSDDADWWKS